MAKHLGVWVDHRQARLIEIKHANAPCQSTVIESLVTEVPRSLRGAAGGGRGDTRHFGEGAAQKHAQRKRAQELKAFYEAIADAAADAAEVVIVGPGTAREELSQHLSARAGPHVRAVAPVDSHLTDAEIDARVKELFGETPARRQVVR